MYFIICRFLKQEKLQTQNISDSSDEGSGLVISEDSRVADRDVAIHGIAALGGKVATSISQEMEAVRMMTSSVADVARDATNIDDLRKVQWIRKTITPGYCAVVPEENRQNVPGKVSRSILF